jgi:hypothetical protein
MVGALPQARRYAAIIPVSSSFAGMVGKGSWIFGDRAGQSLEAEADWFAPYGAPLCPAGHLPLKWGDWTAALVSPIANVTDWRNPR